MLSHLLGIVGSCCLAVAVSCPLVAWRLSEDVSLTPEGLVASVVAMHPLIGFAAFGGVGMLALGAVLNRLSEWETVARDMLNVSDRLRSSGPAVRTAKNRTPVFEHSRIAASARTAGAHAAVSMAKQLDQGSGSVQ